MHTPTSSRTPASRYFAALAMTGFMLFIFTSPGLSQTLDWARTIGANGFDVAQATTADNAGNVYTTGFFSTTVDFDPGPGVDLHSGNDDLFVQKLDSSGNFVWAYTYGLNGSDGGKSIITDDSGNVYVSGNYTGRIFVLKLNSNGTLSWIKMMGNSSVFLDNAGLSIALDDSANIYVSGRYRDSVDFDPGTGIEMHTANGALDAFVLKLDSSGIFGWVKTFGGIDNDEAIGITVDGTDNLFVTGYFKDSVDFDPDTGYAVYAANCAQAIFIQKLDLSGNLVWVKVISADGAGWSITTDAQGNIYVSGEFITTYDFDLGPGITLLTNMGYMDLFVLKLDSAGDFVFAKSIGGTQHDRAHDLAVDADGHIFFTGDFRESVDFDPGPGVEIHAAQGFNGSPDWFIEELDSAGNFVWAATFGDGFVDEAYSLSLFNGAIYVVGYFYGSIDFDPGIDTVIYTGSFGDIFVARYGQCQGNPQLGTISGPSSVCSGTANTYSVPSLSGAFSYTWTLPGGWTGTSSTNSITATATTSGTITVTATNLCGGSNLQTFAVAVNPSPVTSLTSYYPATCINWTTNTLTGLPAGGTYSGAGVTGNNFDPSAAGWGNHPVSYSYTDSMGCSDTSTIFIVVNYCTGTAELVAGGIIVYPNPFTDHINILAKANGDYQLHVYDAFGKMVFGETGNCEFVQLSLEGLPPGAYILQCEIADGIFRQKIIKQ